jgi:hypothetical protein
VKPAKQPRGDEAEQKNAQSERDRVIDGAQVEIADMADQRYPTARLKKPHSTFTVDEERPSPGGLANGL